MVINKKEISARIKLEIMLFSLIYAGLLVASLVFKLSESHILEIAMTIVYLSVIAFTFVKKYCYIYYISDGPKIIMRYTSLQLLSAGNFSIELPKRDFVKAEIKSSYGGLRKELIVYVRTPQGVAKFNPVSLSTLTKEEVRLLKEDLSIQ
jgi:hypothetical protein